jgi:hypothetical protein
MRIVAKLLYKSVSPDLIMKIERLANSGFAIQAILDADNQQVLLVV